MKGRSQADKRCLRNQANKQCKHQPRECCETERKRKVVGRGKIQGRRSTFLLFLALSSYSTASPRCSPSSPSRSQRAPPVPGPWLTGSLTEALCGLLAHQAVSRLIVLSRSTFRPPEASCVPYPQDSPMQAYHIQYDI
ncbi:hypothetical protein ASPZODRAFT_1309793 [Penicilliopsis zonata CBS 506.65]|uniref:Uncharacterized protein n=1 Tax=Penicilliopsis zonata CBS 506.65 TaxID=1073090 RepID=A0A1L9S648_9EURO|nr:hypothetical protein ASPZODRAFT_1309793 [Penicilliopsis zonata CBS 506.65]OJJ42632.1 hypothetical protein ASPZODRAFT_1309793 [Penicilliopsis zonata CBS 506.65]